MVHYDSVTNPYALPRLPVHAAEGMVAASQPLAAQAGIRMLEQGGNAVDAAVAAAAALTVVEPTANGIGGDAFALVWSGGTIHGLNAGGPAPLGLSPAGLAERGITEMPHFGWVPVTVPGIPAAWSALSKRFGRLPFAELMKPAVELAAEGYAVSSHISLSWKQAYEVYAAKLKGEQFSHWFSVFSPEGRAPSAGEIWRSADHARTLERIGASEAADFYHGELADRIDAFSRAHGGFLRKEDLEAYAPEWVDPIRINYRGFDVWEIPPNGQGLSALIALRILSFYESESLDRCRADAIHRAVEAVKLGMTDGGVFITQRDVMHVTVESLLSDRYCRERQRMIGETAAVPEPGTPEPGGTVYLAAADDEGMMVSFIQSNYEGFGSGLVVPGTGIALQNRGRNFSLDPAHVNCLAPGKKTFHTIIPGFLSQDGVPVGPFGVMGGFNQPQGHVQVLINTIDCGLNPQAVLDAPRWRWLSGRDILVEPHFSRHLAQQLGAKGHNVRISMDASQFGRGQIIWRNPENGVLTGGTESRTDGMIAVR